MDKYQELINNLGILKQGLKSKDEEAGKLNEILKEKKQNYKASCEKIESLLKALKEEITRVEENKANLIESLSFSDKTNNICQTQQSHLNQSKETFLKSYKKFYIRESLLTILLRKQTYQAMYNIFFAFLILLAMIFILNLFEGKASIDFQSLTLSFYFKGLYHLLFYSCVKMCLLIALIIIINLTGNIGKVIVPILIIAIVLFIFRNPYIFNTHNFSTLILFFHYWDNCTFILKIFAYYYEKKLLISYHSYTSENSIPCVIEYKKTIVIKDTGEDDKIIFEFKQLNLLREVMNFYKFFYLPTFIYRDVYPSVPRNSRKMIGDLINCILCNVLLYFGFEIAITPIFKNVMDYTSAEKVTSILIKLILYGLIGIFVLIFSFVHSLSNFTAELFHFGDKNFYDDFYNSKTPKEFFQRVAFQYKDFFQFYLVPILKRLFSCKLNEFKVKFINDILTMLFFSMIFDTLMVSLIKTKTPVISLFLILSNLFSYPLELMKTDDAFLLNWLVVSFGIGFGTLILTSENYISQSHLIDLNGLSFIERIIPKIFYLLTYPEKIIK